MVSKAFHISLIASSSRRGAGNKVLEVPKKHRGKSMNCVMLQEFKRKEVVHTPDAAAISSCSGPKVFKHQSLARLTQSASVHSCTLKASTKAIVMEIEIHIERERARYRHRYRYSNYNICCKAKTLVISIDL